MQRGDLRSLIGLAVAVGAAMFLGASLSHPHIRKGRADIPAPVISFDDGGRVTITGTNDAELHYTLDGSSPTARSPRYEKPFVPDGQRAAIELTVIPTSVQWRHPLGDEPTGVVVRACGVDAHGRAGEVATGSNVPREHGGLPVVSITLPQGAFFDPDTGIYVVGNAIFHTDQEFVQRYPNDQKWWKYPGNFHYRGKKFERSAHIDYFASPRSSSPPEWSADVELRVNGNNTRGFPQHALRVTFDQPLKFPLFGDEAGKGRKRILLRCSGNDVDRTFFRDALQHRLCAGLPFETVACVQSVVYVNGAYWGLHNIRERMDEQELARRYQLDAKKITILADRLELYRGDRREIKRFARLLTMSGKWDASGQAFTDSLDRYMDVDGFLAYMAAQIILANTDWPDQNVKWWRYAGDPDTIFRVRDGRWHFIMGDSDQGMGMVMPPAYDMFAHVDRHPTAPLTRLFKACMRSVALRQRFRMRTLDLLNGRLSSARMTTQAEIMRDAIAQEMHHHIDRWRRPLTYAAWQAHVEDLLTFARQRGDAVRSQLDAHLPPDTHR